MYSNTQTQIRPRQEDTKTGHPEKGTKCSCQLDGVQRCFKPSIIVKQLNILYSLHRNFVLLRYTAAVQPTNIQCNVSFLWLIILECKRRTYLEKGKLGSSWTVNALDFARKFLWQFFFQIFSTTRLMKSI